MVALSAVTFTALAALIGSLLGHLAALACRPALVALGGGVPLSPPAFEGFATLTAILMSVVGAATGLMWSVRRGLSGRAEVAGAKRGLLAIAGSMLVLALGMALVGGESLWLLLPSGLVAVVGLALSFPVAARLLAGVATARPIDGWLVAGRITSHMSRKLAVGGVVLTLVVGSWLYFLTLLITNSASQQALMQATLPAGMARISLVDHEA
ncbi:MAG: hypothetical protein QM619_08760 [Micropruina sp.]|uniref:hypothetical protein n=1 Tax=Micropruina sp. TaxID=2737536 RepID=UPI0039E3398F